MTSAAAAYPMIGIMAMPANFKYRDVAKKGRPAHDRWDSFSLKHPPMTTARWAKIFSPFDALDGFDERIAEKEVQYVPRTELLEDDKAELSRRLDILHNLTWNSHMARANRVRVSVEYFQPCADENHFAFDLAAGSYETVTGMVLRVGTDSLRLRTDDGDLTVRFEDIREIRNETGIFETDWEWESP